MKRSELEARERQGIRRALLAWFRRNARDLPWRRTRNPYRIWLSEILLQQTRIETALPYYRRFLKAFPSIRALASAGEDEVLKAWEGLGYYSRARNMHRAAKIIVGERGGRLPKTAQAWRELPGVGRYTAGAIASIAFGEREPALDGNTKRVLARLFHVTDPIDRAATVNTLWGLAEALVPPGDPGGFNQALMELGARVCTPTGPRCGACPIRRYCEAHQLGRQGEVPVRRARRPVPHHEIVAAAICKKGRYLLGRRPSGGMLGGLWEFPGGKVGSGETHEQALEREVEEELGIKVRVGDHLASVKHGYSHFTITLHLYRCEHAEGRPRAIFHDAVKWVPLSHFDRYAFHAANRKLFDWL